MKKLFCLFALTLLAAATGRAESFDWSKATVYFVITDRFANGDPSNDCNYGRINDYGSERLNAATFHGGDLKGLLQKAREGYFSDLGVDVLWMTDVYEQIHGWTSGSGAAINDFPHYGYHGYYPLDYTQMDRNYGTIDDLRALVDELHSQGIRVMLGANINDPGYPTLLDAVQYGFAPTGGMSEQEAASHSREWSYDDWTASMPQWQNWWTRNWLRMSDEGWDQSDKLTVTLYGLPDFKDESTAPVALPAFLKNKWQAEGSANDPWVNPSARRLRSDRAQAPADYVIDWIASWVEEFGIDGFRCDIVEYVHLPRWRQLADACNKALDTWRRNHPEDPASQWTDSIYFTGDFDYASIDRKPDYAAAGFSSMVNFYFPKSGDLDAIVPLWQSYADSVQMHSDWHPFSYLNNSYHREADPDKMLDCGTTLLLAPGAVQLFYGDESGRQPAEGPKLNVDSDQSFRGDMNWNSMDSAALAHYRKLGQIRRAHPAIGRGRQISIDNHTCARILDGDTVIIRVRPNAELPIPLAGLYPEGTVLTDLYTGQSAVVANGSASFPAYSSNIAILCTQPQ